MAVYAPPQSITIRNTADASTNGIKGLVYGPAGAGKTTLMGTAPRPLILSAEAGMLSLKRQTLPYIEVNTIEMLQAAYQYVAFDANSAQFWTICLDSVSEIAEKILANELVNNKDPRKAYGEMANQVMTILRLFRDLPNRHVIFSAKQGSMKDETTGGIINGPMMPGQQLDKQMPYMFDEVFQLVVGRDTNGASFRAIRTERDNNNEAKDRSGALAAWEPANLSDIFTKIQNG